jgi:hypothetical protein
MYLCLSSGDTPRYLQDVVRAIALPVGAELQFRYRQKWLSPKAMDGLDRVRPTRPRVLLAYIDQSDPSQVPLLVPSRFGRLVDATKQGTTVSLTIRLEGYAYAADLAEANKFLRQNATNVPIFEGASPKGSWCTDLKDGLEAISDRTDLAAWELIVGQLAERKQFGGTDLFYTITGIVSNQDSVDTAKGREVSAANGRFEIAGNHEYELRVYHYHPKRSPAKTTSMEVIASSDAVRFSTPTAVAIDSPYDLKHFRYRAEGRVSKQHLVISVRVKQLENDGAVPDTDLLLTVASEWLKHAGYGLIIGVALAVPQAMTVLGQQSSGTTKAVGIVVAFVSCIIAGQVAAFGLRKL